MRWDVACKDVARIREPLANKSEVPANTISQREECSDRGTKTQSEDDSDPVDVVKMALSWARGRRRRDNRRGMGVGIKALARLSLVTRKTNKVILKRFYVARHEWPTKELVKEADLRIMTLFWNSNFDRSRSGWLTEPLAEVKSSEGGIGMPNVTTEINATTAQTIGAWVVTENKLQQETGRLLQLQANASPDYIVAMQKRVYP
ncbi:hypothetical protein JG688_00007244 [Phytophthora aleatoria]|uniref:Uncharacterized protein n=1 Tax=Phytophthora aleatoria TaxID=2496075 RepID=A0A8J5IZY3_9STRA|nr:hypothetical protein JG688_00007244 [Phytophthora aleatoria]